MDCKGVVLWNQEKALLSLWTTMFCLAPPGKAEVPDSTRYRTAYHAPPCYTLSLHTARTRTQHTPHGTPTTTTRLWCQPCPCCYCCCTGRCCTGCAASTLAAVEWPTTAEMVDACTKGLGLQAEFEVGGV